MADAWESLGTVVTGSNKTTTADAWGALGKVVKRTEGEEEDTFESQLEGGETVSAEEEAQLERRRTLALEQEKERRNAEGYLRDAEVRIPGLETGTRRLTFADSPLGPVAGTMATVGDVAGPAVSEATELSGQVAVGLLLDIGTGEFTGSNPFRNTREAFRTLYTDTPRTDKPSLPEKFVEAAGMMVPALAATRAGVPLNVAFGAQMGLNAYEQTKDPDYATRQAAVGYLLANAAKVGETVGEAAGVSLAKAIPHEGVIEAAKFAGRQGVMNALALAGQAPELLKEYQDNPEKALETITEQIAINLMFDLPLVPGATRTALANEIANRFVKSPAYKEYVDFRVSRAGLPGEAVEQRDALDLAAAKAETSRAEATAEALRKQQEADFRKVEMEFAAEEEAKAEAKRVKAGAPKVPKIEFEETLEGEGELGAKPAPPKGPPPTLSREATVARASWGEATDARRRSWIGGRGDVSRSWEELTAGERSDVISAVTMKKPGGTPARTAPAPAPTAPPAPAPTPAPTTPPRPRQPGDRLNYGPKGELVIIDQTKDGKKFLVRYVSADPNSPPIELPKEDVFSMPYRRGVQDEPTVASKADIEEREAIDRAVGENNAMGLPSKVIYDAPEDPNVPFAGRRNRRMAYPDAEGNIHIDREVLREWLARDIRPGQEQAAITSLLRHEGIHAIGRQVIPDADLAAVYQGLTAIEKGLLRKAYAGRVGGVGHTDVQMGHEYVRRAMERLMGTPVFERVGTKGLERLTQPVLDIIERIIIAVRKAIGKNAKLDSILERMQKGVDRVKAGESIEEPGAYRRKQKDYEKEYWNHGYMDLDSLEAYFRPGRIVKSYSGWDRVIEFNRESWGGWKVKVEGVRVNDAGEWEPEGRPRTHVTEPGIEQMAEAGVFDRKNQVGEIPNVLALPTGKLSNKEMVRLYSEIGERIVDPFFMRERGEHEPGKVKADDMETAAFIAREVLKRIGEPPGKHTFVDDFAESHAKASINGPHGSDFAQKAIMAFDKANLTRDELRLWMAGMTFKQLAEKSPYAKEDPNAPEAIRRARPSSEGQEEMRLGAEAKPEERISAEEGMQRTAPPINMREVSERADMAVHSKDVSFEEFSRDLRLNYQITPGQVRETWEDAVWRKAMEELPKKEEGFTYGPSPKEQLLKRAEELEAESKVVGKRPEELRLFNEPERQERLAKLKERAEEIRKEAESASDEPTKIVKKRDYEATYKPGEARPEAKVAGEALRLIHQADKGIAPALRRKAVTPDDVRVGTKDAFIEFDAKDTVYGAELIRDASMDRTVRVREVVSPGVARTIKSKRASEGQTKRLTLLLNEKTGAVDLVSTHKNNKGEVMIYDPRFSHKLERASIPYDRLRRDAPEYKPIRSILLDEPVKNFRQKFDSLDDFNERIGNRTKEDYEAAQRFAEEPAIEGADRGAPRLRIGEELTENEAGALFNTLIDEVGDITDRQDVDDLLGGLRARAEQGKLTGRDWAAINALNKIDTAVQKAGKLTNEDQILEATKDGIFDLARSAISGDDFISLAMGAYTAERATPDALRSQPKESEGEPGGQREYRERASQRRERLKRKVKAEQLLGEAMEGRRLQDTLEATEQLSPSAYKEVVSDTINPDPNAPEAFLRSAASISGKGARGLAGGIRTAMNATIVKALRLGSEQMVDRIRRIGEGLAPYELRRVEALTGKMNEIISKQKGYEGVLMRLWGKNIIEMGGRLDAPTWLNELQVVVPGETAIRNVREAIEGRLQAPTAKAQEFVDAGRRDNLRLGQFIEAVSPGFVATGKMQANWTPLMFDAVMAHTDDPRSIREKIIRGTAAANGIPESFMRSYMNRMRKQLSEPGIDGAQVSAIAQDFARKFPRVITDVWTGGKILGIDTGHWEPIIHSTFQDYFRHGIDKAAAIRAFRETYPRDNPSVLKQDYTELRGMIDQKFHGLVDSTYRVLQGQPSESALGQQSIVAMENWMRNLANEPGIIGNVGSVVEGTYAAASPVLRAMMLTRQIALQPAEVLSGADATFFGYKRSAADTLARLSNDYGLMEAMGIVDRMIYNDSFDPRAKTRSVGRIASNMIRRVFVENALNEMQEAQNGMGALVTARRIQDMAAGGAPIAARQQRHLRKVFEYMGFTRNEVSRMMGGDTRLLLQMQRKAASFLSAGHKHPAERSRLLNSRLFQQAFWFWDYPMARTNQFLKITDTILKDLENGRWREAATGTHIMAKFMFGTAVQGSIQRGLLAMFSGGLYGFLIQQREARDEPVQFITESMRAAMGGPIQQLINGYEDRGLYGALDNVGKMLTPVPFSLSKELTDAVMGHGKYRDISKLDALARFAAGKTPGLQAVESLRAGVALHVLGDPATMNEKKMKESLKAFYRWRRENYGWVMKESYLKEDEDRETFDAGMRKARNGLGSGNQKLMLEGLREAAEGKKKLIAKEEKRKRGRPKDRILESMARSIETQNLLKVPSGRDAFRELKPSELKALTEHIGEEPVRLLQRFDAMLKAVADDIRPGRRR